MYDTAKHIMLFHSRIQAISCASQAAENIRAQAILRRQCVVSQTLMKDYGLVGEEGHGYRKSTL